MALRSLTRIAELLSDRTLLKSLFRAIGFNGKWVRRPKHSFHRGHGGVGYIRHRCRLSMVSSYIPLDKYLGAGKLAAAATISPSNCGRLVWYLFSRVLRPGA